MHDNSNDPPTDPQTPKTRVIWRDGNPYRAEEIDGVVTLPLEPIAIVPDACWNMPYWRLCALPNWANNINDPAEQMGVLVAVFGSKQLEAIDALSKIKAHVEAMRLLIDGGVTNLTEKRLADLLDMVKTTLRTLDP